MNKAFDKLKTELERLGRVAIAFSSGVDSAFLLKAAVEVLGCENVLAITVNSCVFPGRELEESKAFCKKEGVQQVIIEADELSIEGFSQNPPDRCYLCKKDLFGKLLQVAANHGFSNVAEGSNMDDFGDYRPGMKAVRELGVCSPLQTAGLTKDQIREFSKEWDLPTWNKPSFACLASRIPYGEEITHEKLNLVDKAEQFLLERGYRQFRVRVHGDQLLARIEILPEDFSKMLEQKERDYIDQYLKTLGFSYVSLDLMGYRTGSMNEGLPNVKK